MSGRYRLSPTGEPIHEPNLFAWARWYESAGAERRLAEDLIELPTGTYRVSTVFLGLDHAHGGGPPLLWETMVFAVSNPATEWADCLADRYTSRADALAGHAAMIERVKAGPLT